MVDLTLKSSAQEQMDAADLAPDVYAAVLHDLARVNRWTFTARSALAFLRRATGSAMGRFSLLDVGFGDGDVLRTIARWARRRGIEATLVGVDMNENSLAAARSATPGELRIDYRAGDYRDQTEAFDFIISSQVAHHMSDEQLSGFLGFMEREARRGWLVCDLHRHRFAHFGYPFLARLLGVHPIVREDGQLSIARSLRPGEWQAVLQAAGMPVAEIAVRRRFPFRLAIERLRQD
jgi:2-polyprenyl-3-methyl-5-hydroxy-6-metoxy-1,4-benzoquinol methylase